MKKKLWTPAFNAVAACRSGLAPWLPALLVILVSVLQGSGAQAAMKDNLNHTVSDPRTGLVWQQYVPEADTPPGVHAEPGAMTWVSALSYCEALTLGDADDWRLPNIKELKALVDHTRYYPAINITLFPGAQPSGYWSSTTDAIATNASFANFYDGRILAGGKDNSLSVRCVRGGELGPSDTTPPTGSILINNGAAFCNNTGASLALAATDTGGSELEAMRIRNEIGPWTDWAPFAALRGWILTSGVGSKTVFAQFRDNAGNLSDSDPAMPGAQPYEATVFYEIEPPTGSVVINNGALYTNSLTVDLKLWAVDTGGSGLDTMGIVMMGIPSPIIVSYQPTYPWTFTGGAGVKTVYAQFRDHAGNVSLSGLKEVPDFYQDSIIYDPLRPTGSILINNGAVATETLAVTLNLSAADSGGSGLQAMRFKNAGHGWSNWEPYQASRDWTLAPGSGNKTVFAQFRDNAGNLSDSDPGVPGDQPYTDTIAYDLLPPTGSIRINDGATATNTTTVTLNLSAADVGGSGLDAMMFKNEGGTWSDWEPYAATKSWTLTSEPGMKTVSAQFRDQAGNLSLTYEDTILFEISPPTGTILINNGAVFTGTTAVTLNLTATDAGGSGIGSMRFRNAGGVWSAWESFRTAKAWTLVGGPGIKTVSAEFRDRAGNVSDSDPDTPGSQPYEETIVYDPVRPVGSILINNGAAYTTTADVTLNLSATDAGGSGLDAMRFRVGSVTTWGDWEPYQTTKAWTLTGGFGNKNVFAQFRDNAGNLSDSDPVTPGAQPYRATIIYDPVPPTGSILINNGAVSTDSTAVTLSLSAADTGGSGLAGMRFKNGSGPWSNWEPFLTTKAWTLTGGAGRKTVFAQFRDSAWNLSDSDPDTPGAQPYVDAITYTGL